LQIHLMPPGAMLLPLRFTLHLRIPLLHSARSWIYLSPISS